MHFTRTGIVGGIVACSIAGLVTINLNQANASRQATVIDGVVNAETGANLEGWTKATHRPIMPAEGQTAIAPGHEIAIGKVGGLTGVSATLNGTPLKTREQDEDFVLTVGPIEGSGVASLLVSERFEDGSVLDVPYTVYADPVAGGGRRASRAEPVLGNAVSAVSIGWEQVGLLSEGEQFGPRAIASLDGGGVAVLDTVNSRVISVSASGEVGDLRALPTATFVSFASNGSQLLAIDPITLQAVDVNSGEVFGLPAIVQVLGISGEFSLDESGALYGVNPGDGVPYVIGRLADRSGSRRFEATGDISRNKNAGRVNAEGNRLLVQRSIARPLEEFDLGTIDAVSVIDFDQLGDGRTVVLVSTVSGDKAGAQLVTIDGADATIFDVDLNVGVSMNTHMTTDGKTVTIASATATGLSLTTYQP
jgi:hypothetical protein